MSWSDADAHERYLAHQCHPIPGAPTGDGGGAFSGVSSPGAAPLFKWIGERNARPLRWEWE
jgi:hypothetical protein